MIRTETASIVGVLVAGFPSVKMSRETVEVWHRALHDLPFEDVKVAVEKLLMTSEWFPTIALIRKATLDAMGMLPKSADEAWVEILGAINDHGYAGYPEFSPLVREAVLQVGWRDICMSTQPEAIRRSFVKAYDAIALKQTHLVLTAPLELTMGG